MIIQPFDMANLDIVATKLAMMWSKDILHNIAHPVEFSREIVLNLFYDSQLALQACDDDGTMQAIAFARLKNDVNNSEQWIENFLKDIDDDERKNVLETTSYLLRSERELFNLMADDSAQFSFFFSNKRGYGNLLHEQLMQMLIDRGVKWSYLITDSTCTWQYFPHHGYERVYEELVKQFSTSSLPYYYYIYRKRIT